MTLVTRKVVVGGIPVGVLSRREWADAIVAHCQSSCHEHRRPKVIFAANGKVVALYAISSVFRAHFQQADGVTADGQPLVWASRLTRSPLPERAATTDLFHDVARAAQQGGLTFFLFGATERSSAIAEAQIRARYPALKIVGRRNGYFAPEDEGRVAGELKALRPDVLWVGMGAEREVAFVARNLAALCGIGCIVTCGGLFDYFTPEIKRAPDWMQRFSLEWFYRTCHEPRKYFWRYFLTNPVAAILLLTRTRSQSVSRQSGSS